MPRARSNKTVEICGDCGASDATWASINKGILLCTQCCSVHRSLGRHISQVKNLLKSVWHPNQLILVTTLNNNGANNIWENALLENGSKLLKKKPNPKDPLSVKQEYIKAKHEQLAYSFTQNIEDGKSGENELGKELCAIVRTANVETTFRLLALGADPNYFDDEKNTTPLHVATKSEQKLQVELLLIYGADPSCPDAQGKTPVDYARMHHNKDLLHRLIESQYEVTDTFSQYLSMTKPDHKNGIHFHIPQMGFQPNPSSMAKLQNLPNHVFEELVMDVFDEVERRETESIWLGCADTTDLNEIPFLPVDSTLSSTRNQGRQKLARFSTPEFKTLVYDILIDTQRRQNLRDQYSLCSSAIIDEDPLYDTVASDDDYATVPTLDEADASPERKSTSPEKSFNESKESVYIENTAKTNYMLEQLTKKLKDADHTISFLKGEVASLKSYVEILDNENTRLKKQLTYTNALQNLGNGDNIRLETKSHSIIRNGEEDELKRISKQQRPSSMYETREGIGKVANWNLMKREAKQTTQSLYACEARETVLQCTEYITRCIQMLCQSIQEPQKEECVSCADKVNAAISKLDQSLPKDAWSDEIIKKMKEVACRLKPECAALQLAGKKDVEQVHNHFGNIRDIAFHLAKFTKEIVTKYSVT